jgi:hypothetical protein
MPALRKTLNMTVFFQLGMKEKKKINYAAVFFSIFGALIMISSVIGYMIADSQNTVVRYKAIKFTSSPDGWKFKHSGREYTLSFTPTSLENINISDSISFEGVNEIDATYDENASYKEEIAASLFELSNALPETLYLRKGFTTNTTYGLPIITCKDAARYIAVIYYKFSNNTAISKEGNCIIIESDNQNSFLPLTDKLIYRILGVI